MARNAAIMTKKMVDHRDTLKYWMEVFHPVFQCIKMVHHLLCHYSSISLEDDDCVVMDRGFRDVLELFSTLGYNATMSSFWSPATRQQ